ncbi:unnamed protein product [Phaeothamnion confervicola]
MMGPWRTTPSNSPCMVFTRDASFEPNAAIQRVYREAYRFASDVTGGGSSGGGDAADAGDGGGGLSCLDRVVKEMSAITPVDLGLSASPSDYERLASPLYVPIAETPAFDLVMLVLPAGTTLPLHDHPDMTVLSRVLMGSLRIRSWDWIPGADVDAKGGPSSPQRRRARVSSEKRLTAAAPVHIATPGTDNLHEFFVSGVGGPCVVLDILLPPYDPPAGRRCLYYRCCAAAPSAAGALAGPPAASAPCSGRGGGGNNGNGGVSWRPWHAFLPPSPPLPPPPPAVPPVSMAVGEEAVLERIPEPTGLPIFTPYRGPPVDVNDRGDCGG